MKKPAIGAMVTLAAIAGVWSLAAVSALGQAKSPTAPPLVVTAFGGEAPKTRYVTPKTPWGEPDLQGVWSTDDTSGIPMARPAQFGDRLYLNADEYASRAKQIERGVTQGDQEAVGAFRFDFARRAFYQTSLIVDPPDGRLPAFTPEGAQRPDAARHVRRRPARLDDGLLALRAVHHARHSRLDAARDLRQRRPDLAGRPASSRSRTR